MRWICWDLFLSEGTVFLSKTGCFYQTLCAGVSFGWGRISVVIIYPVVYMCLILSLVLTFLSNWIFQDPLSFCFLFFLPLLFDPGSALFSGQVLMRVWKLWSLESTEDVELLSRMLCTSCHHISHNSAR